MAKSLIEKDSERQFVNDPESYLDDGWTVIATGASAEPKDDHDFDEATKKWKKNPEKENERARKARKVAISRGDLLEMLEELTTRVELLEAERA